jgi:hypothetical protein
MKRYAFSSQDGSIAKIAPHECKWIAQPNACKKAPILLLTLHTYLPSHLPYKTDKSDLTILYISAYPPSVTSSMHINECVSYNLEWRGGGLI